MVQQQAGERDRARTYKEENRRILQESIEVAPFTAKICSSETDSEPNPYPRIPSLPSLSHPQRLHQEKETELPAAHLYQLIQQAASQHSLPPSSYFTTLSSSVVNEPPRLYPSRELSSYFEKVSREQDSAASSLSLGGGAAFSSKSLSKPPPLIKHQPDGEGLLGKISEQLNQQVSLSNMQRYPLSTIVSPVSPDLSLPSSQTQSQTLTQRRCMPALHRAPVFHPPIQQTLDRKDAGYGRLSPPTLTPIQPVSSPGKVSEQQRPPTLLPELREVSAVCKGGAAMTSSEVWRSGDSQSHDKAGWHSERSPGRKPGATTASVIVRPSTCIKYDGSPGAKTSSSAKDSLTGRMFPGSRPQTVCLKLAYERDRESGGKVILPNTNLEEAACVQYNNNLRVSQSQGTFPVSVSAAANSVCNRSSAVTRTVSDMAPYGVLSRRPNTSSDSRTESCGPRGRAFHSGPGLGPRAELHQQEEGSSRTSSPNLHPGPNPSLASSTQASPNPSQSYSGSFIHLKKHKAALAAAQQSRGPSSSSRVSGPESLIEPSNSKALHISPPPPLASASVQDHRTTASPGPHQAGASPSPGPLPNGQPAQMNQSQSQPNYHKLKKAWLTRHSEEDSNRNINTMIKTEDSNRNSMIKTEEDSNRNRNSMIKIEEDSNRNTMIKTEEDSNRNRNSMIKTEAADKVTTSVSPSVLKAVTTSVSPSVLKSVTTSVSPSVFKAVTTSVSPSVSKSVTTSVSPSVSKSVTTTVSPSVFKAVTTTVSPSVFKAVTTTVSPSVLKSVTTTVSPSVSKAVTTTESPSVFKAVTTSVSPSVSKAVTTTVSPSVSKAVTTTVSPSVSKAVTTTVSPSVSKAVTTTVSPSVSEMEMIKPCTVSLIASTSSDVEMKIEEVKGQEDKIAPEDRNPRRGSKRAYDHDSASESGEDSDASEGSRQEQRAKRKPKPTYKKKQNDMQKRKGERDEEELKPNGIFRSAREKTKLKLSSNNGIPRSVLKDWRKVKKLKQTGESFLQDDSCSEIGPNLQKCRECRVVRSKKGEQPSHSPVFCRFYYFRR
uniref:JmjC domain-containing protein n=2 Tax=Hucho hucho TaxID=62062 RepID=A0A4W5K331_9TELE